MGIIDRIMLKKLQMDIQPNQDAFGLYGASTLIEYTKQLGVDIDEMLELGKYGVKIKLDNPRITEAEPERITVDVYAPSALDVKVVLDAWRKVHRNQGYTGGVSKGSQVLMNTDWVERVYVENDMHNRFENPLIEIDIKTGKMVA